MNRQSDERRRLMLRAHRISQGDHRTEPERVLDAAHLLADEIETVPEPHNRILYWGEALNYVTVRARRDWLRITGQEPPLEGPRV